MARQGSRIIGGTKPETDPQRVAARDKMIKAVEMRKAGMTFEEIARRLDYASRSSAYEAITRWLRTEGTEDRDELRRIECERLDRLQLAAWGNAIRGDTTAITTVLRIMGRRAKLLGLDAPTQHEVVTLDAIDAECRALATQLGYTEVDQAIAAALAETSQ